jgi:hypothetical protein
MILISFSLFESMDTDSFGGFVSSQVHGRLVPWVAILRDAVKALRGSAY